jgi:hypothetical protein
MWGLNGKMCGSAGNWDQLMLSVDTKPLTGS